jgi:hypothetical protein
VYHYIPVALEGNKSREINPTLRYEIIDKPLKSDDNPAVFQVDAMRLGDQYQLKKHHGQLGNPP